MERKEFRNRFMKALERCDEFELRSIALACVTGITALADETSYSAHYDGIINSIEFICPEIKDIYDETVRGD